MIKKIFVVISIAFFQISTACAWSGYSIATCYDKQFSKKMVYACLEHSYWASALWVKIPDADKLDYALPGSCPQDTGPVFKSTKSILEECKEVDKGETLIYGVAYPPSKH